MTAPTRQHRSRSILADVDFAEVRRVANAERAKVIRGAGHAVIAWLNAGLKLRFSDDAITHPAAGKPCGC